MGFCIQPDTDKLAKDIETAAKTDEVKSGALEKLQDAVSDLNGQLNSAASCSPVDNAKEIYDKLDPTVKVGEHYRLAPFMQWDTDNNRWGGELAVFDKNPQAYILRSGKPEPVELDKPVEKK